MGRKGFFGDEEAKRKRRERRVANGYVSRAHHEQDAVRGRHNRTDEVKNLQRQYVTLYEE